MIGAGSEGIVIDVLSDLLIALNVEMQHQKKQQKSDVSFQLLSPIPILSHHCHEKYNRMANNNSNVSISFETEILTFFKIIFRYFAAHPQETNAHRYNRNEESAEYEEIHNIENDVVNAHQQNDLDEVEKGDDEGEGENESLDGYQTPHDYIEVF